MTKKTQFQEAEDLISSLSPAEKVQLLQRITLEIVGIYPGIESHDEIAGGEPCIVRTRIPVWIQSRKLGASEADLLRSYPTLNAEDLVNAWAYYNAHRDEIEKQIIDNEAA